MPDIQTEMQKILQAWEQPEPIKTTEEPTVFTTTTNTSRATFEEVRDTPGLPTMQYVRRLEDKGYKKSSTTSLLAQMVRQGHLWKGSDGGLHPNQKEYKPLKSTKTIARKAKKAKTSKVITSAPVVETPKRELVDVPVRNKVEDILDDISLSDAHELYRKLHVYFGGLSK